MPLDAKDRAILQDHARRPKDSLIARIAGDLGGGDGGVFNYGLTCGGCGELLGRLGVFRLREPTGKVPFAHRFGHCGVCHAITVVREDGGRASVDSVTAPTLVGGVCVVCPRGGAEGLTLGDVVESNREAKRG